MYNYCNVNRYLCVLFVVYYIMQTVLYIIDEMLVQS